MSAPPRQVLACDRGTSSLTLSWLPSVDEGGSVVLTYWVVVSSVGPVNATQAAVMTPSTTPPGIQLVPYPVPVPVGAPPGVSTPVASMRVSAPPSQRCAPTDQW